MTKRKIRTLIFSVIPTLLIVLTAEISIRIAELANPEFSSVPLPEEMAGLFRRDPNLFWALRPNLDMVYEGARVTTNGEGLRGPETPGRGAEDIGILSLGESTTFGFGVGDQETYSAVLERLANAHPTSPHVRVFNAGVPAYSSFQSVKYAQLHGLGHGPEIVLFYHELNDYLPTSLRDSSNSEIGAVMTDQELFESRTHGVLRVAMRHSALVRFTCLKVSAHRVRRFNGQSFANPLVEIGLPDIGLRPRLQTFRGEKAVEAGVNEQALGRRVSEVERQQNFHDLKQLCAAAGALLVVIHPAYADSTPHTCVLTRFCEAEKVLMFDAFDVLHPVQSPDLHLFIDSWHPNVQGHYRLGAAIFEFLKESLPHLFPPAAPVAPQ